MDLRSPIDAFAPRHLGSNEADVASMLQTLGLRSLEELADRVVPENIRTKAGLAIGEAVGEHALLGELSRLSALNDVFRTYLGMGYYDTITPGVIRRNIFENPGWYTQYTPHQAEIAQGRLEALLNFQTMVTDLTGLPVANASLLDEATACAEAMAMCHAIAGPESKRDAFFVSIDCHPQTIAVVQTRAASLGIDVMVGDAKTADFGAQGLCGVLLQYPTSD